MQRMEGEEDLQPTLSDILKAVHTCAASVHAVQDQFGGLKVTLLRQDLRKVCECTTSVESRVSDIPGQTTSTNVRDQIHFSTGESQQYLQRRF